MAGQRVQRRITYWPVCRLAIWLTIILVPGILQIAFDRRPFAGDESQYARASVELLRTLMKSPLKWLHLLISISPDKPSALVWLGQFFVPLASLVGSVDRALHLCTWCIQALTLVLLAAALWEMSARQLQQAVLIGLICASAPLFIYLGGYYMVESLQTLVAAWFLFVMVRALESPPALTLGFLFLGLAYAPLTKQTSLLFCVWPALIALLCALRRIRTHREWGWRNMAVKIVWIAAFMQIAATSIWYWRHWKTSLAYTMANTQGPLATIWGKQESFIDTLIYWLGTVGVTFVLPAVAPMILSLIVAATVHRAFTGRDNAGRYFSICGGAAFLQVVTVLIVFSLNFNRLARFLIPMLPSVAFVVCWSVAHFGSRWLTTLVMAVFAGQLGLVWGLVWGYGFLVVSPDPRVVGANPETEWRRAVLQIDRDGHNARLLKSIVDRTCYDSTPLPYVNVIAIDPGFRGDWLAPEPANYVATRDARSGANGPACVYGYLGGGFLGERAETAWEDLVSRNVRYIITIDPRVHIPPIRTYNLALDKKHFPLFWSQLERSFLFRAESALPEDPDIRVFRRVDQR